MLSDTDKLILKTELRKSTYDGMTAREAYDYLFVPTPVSPIRQPTGFRLTPQQLFRMFGPNKTEAVLTYLEGRYPKSIRYWLEEGLDCTNGDTVDLLNDMVATGQFIQSDVDACLRAATTEVPQPDIPHRFLEVFNGRNVEALRRAAGLPPQRHIVQIDAETTAILNDPGFPNAIDMRDFGTAWTEVRP